MSWRESFLKNFGPGVLSGISFGNWVQLLAANRFAVDRAHLPRLAAVTLQSLQNSALKPADWLQMRLRRRETAEVAPPIFLLGHWRNGTTHLHNLLAVDDRFAFINTFQAVFPHTFLTTERMNAPVVGAMMPERRPMDNVVWGVDSPQEDEFALLNLCQISPCLGWIFPDRRDVYDLHLTLRDVSEGERRRWSNALVGLVRKLTFKYGKPLVLKSPPHTGRVRLLLDLFPGAKFVHIRRDPYAVFPSSRKTFLLNAHINGLKPPRMDGFDDWVVEQYRTLYDAYFDDKPLIPPGHLHELAYEDLEADPVGEVRRLYEALGLPDFAPVEPALRTYVDSLAGYVKNSFTPLPDELRSKLADRWKPCFDAWGYPR